MSKLTYKVVGLILFGLVAPIVGFCLLFPILGWSGEIGLFLVWMGINKNTATIVRHMKKEGMI